MRNVTLAPAWVRTSAYRVAVMTDAVVSRDPMVMVGPDAGLGVGPAPPHAAAVTPRTAALSRTCNWRVTGSLATRKPDPYARRALDEEAP
jgi:hypothetical protein